MMIRIDLRYWLPIAGASLGLVAATLADDPPQPPRLRVLAYNIHHGEGTDGKLDLPRQAKIVRESGADLVALQEVDRVTARTGKVDQALELARLTGMHQRFGRTMEFDGGEYGNAVLSRVVPRAATTHALPRMAGPEPRAALAVTLDARDGLPELDFVSTHFCHQSGMDRLAQAEELARLFPPRGGRSTLLAGDFNSRAEAEPIRRLLQDWRDTLGEVRKIDYVFTRAADPWKVLSARFLNEPVASDHRPLLVELEWRAPAR